MKTVTVSASRTYDIHIGSGLLAKAGEYIKKQNSCTKACIISDSNVFPLYGALVKKSMITAGIETTEFVIPAGEESKNGLVYLELLEFLAQNEITRSDAIVALGGGVVGDLSGFAAATYLRGIPFVQLPTTLLAAVDSSVGGKTAIDLKAGKNLAGAFYQPSLVLCDVDTLNTLPEDVFRDGCAEVIKYGILYDADFFSYLENVGVNFDRTRVITRCVELKRDVVIEDEFDTGARMKLNLGHTVGHSIEKASQFGISHGKAVAMGTAIVSRAFSCPDRERIVKILASFGLPVSAPYAPDQLHTFMLSDKKRVANNIHLIVPRGIGNCEIVATPIEDLKTILQAGLDYEDNH